MGKLFAKYALYSTLIHFLLVGKVGSRHLPYNAAELVSDAVRDGQEDESNLRLKGIDSSEEECRLMYGFLPCSTNIPSHVFLIVIYEYLLYHAEYYASGHGRIFRLLGKNFYATSFSQLLDALPDSLILLVTGLSSSKEKAQEYVLTGAGLLAGSTILLLTLSWGTCFICGSRKFYEKPGSKVQNKARNLLTGYGVLTDPETSFDAKIMNFSLIPFVIILLPAVFGLSYSSKEYKIVLFVSLSASVFLLTLYFYYQQYEPRMWNRRFEYAEIEQKVEMHVPFYEVQALMLHREKHLMIRRKQMEQRLKNLETNKENIEMIEEWIDGTRKLVDTDPYLLNIKETKNNQVEELLQEEKNTLIEHMWYMMEPNSMGIMHRENQLDESAIDSLFERIDINKDESITPTELKDFIMQVNYEGANYRGRLVDEKMAEIMIRHFDIDGNGNIDKDEFRSGVNKLLVSCNVQKRSHDSNQKNHKYKAEEMFKAVILLIIGILMLTLLAEPLVESVRQFSESVNIEPFYVSFILVPFATNARTAVATIGAACQKRHHITSLTFSEIYHKVFLNNILGFSVLVSVIYFRGFTWHFSAEILVVFIVCLIMGSLASFKSIFPNWTLLIPFPLYLSSMVVVYYVNDAFQFT